MIGIFDSGMGGLTVMREIRKEIPSCDIVYFGDIKHAPYGSRTRSELSVLTASAVKRLQQNGATKIVSACNSLSASLAVSVFDVFSLEPGHIIEMVGPTVAYLKDIEGKKIALCATPATISSELYQQAFQMLGKDVQYIGIPELAGAIEFGAPRAQLKEIIEYAFEGKSRDFDFLVLACTHYPLAEDVFAELFPNVELFDPARAVAERAKKLFWPQEVGDTLTRFLITEDTEYFRARVAEMFPNINYTIEVVT